MSNSTDPTRFGGYTPLTHRPANGGEQWRFRFDNGYGASVVQGPFTYGGPEGLYEVGVIKWDGDRARLTYDTPITDNVIGYLSEAEVTETLRKIEALASAAPEAVAP